LPFSFKDNEELDVNKILGLDDIKKKPRIKDDNDFK
jgi:hypothetical protein